MAPRSFAMFDSENPAEVSIVPVTGAEMLVGIDYRSGTRRRATAFYEGIGFTKNDTFSNEQGSCMVWSGAIHVMLLDHAFYATFTGKRIIDARTESGALLCLSFDSREAVDRVHQQARAAGGTEARPIQDHGFMYGGAFDDPDGHGWETM